MSASDDTFIVRVLFRGDDAREEYQQLIHQVVLLVTGSRIIRRRERRTRIAIIQETHDLHGKILGKKPWEKLL